MLGANYPTKKGDDMPREMTRADFHPPRPPICRCGHVPAAHTSEGTREHDGPCDGAEDCHCARYVDAHRPTMTCCQ